MPLMQAFINPLKCLVLDPPVPGVFPPPSPPTLLEYLFAPGADGSVEAFAARYQEVASIPKALWIAPAEANILNKLVWPLRHAIGAYCLADYLGCVALSGTVGEMVAILLWEVDPVPEEDIPRDGKGERLLKRSFEDERQETRVEVLRALGRIDGSTKGAFTDLRKIRKRYLHLFSQGHDSIQADARRALELATRLLSFLLALTIPEPGRVALRPQLAAYVAARVPLAPET